jgi:hypothetical protein
MPNRVTPVIALALLVAAFAAACGGAAVTQEAVSSPAAPDGAVASGGGPASPAPSDAPAQDPEAIDHPTGSTDVILRVSESGGFVPMDYAMIRVPQFTLYGDGRALVVAPEGTAKGAPGMLEAVPVLLETRLSEPEIQAVLQTALIEGRLGVAKERYEAMAFDLPTTVFEIQAGGVSRTVSVGGLVAEPAPGPDAPVLAALARLADRLRSIRAETRFEAPAWIAVIAEWERNPGEPAAAAWPWPDATPADFAPPLDGDPIPFARRLLTLAEAEATGADLSAGGATGLRFEGPDGKLYVVVLRPALPEEAAAT